MKLKKGELKKKALKNFKAYDGGTNVDTEYTIKNAKKLGSELQKSFDKIFPELLKPSKHRKHIIFDNDIFEFFEGLCGNSGTGFSPVINSALRSFVKERVFFNSTKNDPVAELLRVRERERELLKEIKELNLLDELKKQA